MDTPNDLRDSHHNQDTFAIAYDGQYVPKHHSSSPPGGSSPFLPPTKQWFGETSKEDTEKKKFVELDKNGKPRGKMAKT
jgi:hypothetical protein